MDERRQEGAKPVVASGCFDLLHVGHLRHFRAARAQGDLLVVLISDDPSVRMMKGRLRPVFAQDDRRELLLALDPVDAVIVHPQAALRPVLKRLAPCVFVKGPDYKGFAPRWLTDIVGEIVLVGPAKVDSTRAVIRRCARIQAEVEARGDRT